MQFSRTSARREQEELVIEIDRADIRTWKDRWWMLICCRACRRRRNPKQSRCTMTLTEPGQSGDEPSRSVRFLLKPISKMTVWRKSSRSRKRNFSFERDPVRRHSSLCLRFWIIDIGKDEDDVVYCCSLHARVVIPVDSRKVCARPRVHTQRLLAGNPSSITRRRGAFR